MHFKDPDTGAHTNGIESSWRAAKAVTTAAGRKKAHVAGNLAKYMFFKMCRDKKDDRFDTFMRFAGRLYNPCSPPSSVDHDSDVEADDDVIFD